MDFSFSQDQIDLRDAVREYLDGEHDPAVLRALDEGSGRDPAIRSGLVEMGLAGIMVPESKGGLGLGLLEATMIGVELGRANVSEPLADTAFVAVPWLLAQDRADALDGVASGERVIAIADPANGWVADLDHADALLSSAGLVEPAPVTDRLDTVDPLRQLFALPDEVTHDPLLFDLAALTCAAQMVGAAERMMALSTDYAEQREQFGQPIGRFQAIKHHLASVAVKVEFARPVLWRAAASQNDERFSLNVSHVKIAATDAAMLAAETAIQVHGAMGYTYEVDLHFWMKRVWALAGAWGDRATHLRRVEAMVIDGAMDIGPSETFTKELTHA
ncbi:acyl-CoA dehydrogenase family protein [Croceicoccus sp. F390]|uniref:Acyl-CoA dehydrogenase family protein n=1 Tax=Croceicoccus esteveae TaxID=3075597 RepID=A0ABU2ZIX5_9SPHN|nr:acyl-CoA dehydrogenase family protein [Croceicoccus sp. F390]MDT0575357.1 acyl-CoA dehydrogenase family protein [Croceicoccus sp. F390]